MNLIALQIYGNRSSVPVGRFILDLVLPHRNHLLEYIPYFSCSGLTRDEDLLIYVEKSQEPNVPEKDIE